MSAQYEHEHETNFDSAEKSASAVSKFHTHSIPLDMEDIERDWDKPVAEAGIAAKASVIVRVGMLDLGAGTGSFRVREMMHRIAYPLGVHVRADVNLTDIEASCTDGKDRITEVVDLPTTGVNTERIWLLEHFADWFNVNLGKGSMYHSQSDVSEGLMQHLDKRDASQVSAELSKQLKERQKAEQNQRHEDAQAHQGVGQAVAVHIVHNRRIDQGVGRAKQADHRAGDAARDQGLQHEPPHAQGAQGLHFT